LIRRLVGSTSEPLAEGKDMFELIIFVAFGVLLFVIGVVAGRKSKDVDVVFVDPSTGKNVVLPVRNGEVQGKVQGKVVGVDVDDDVVKHLVERVRVVPRNKRVVSWGSVAVVVMVVGGMLLSAVEGKAAELTGDIMKIDRTGSLTMGTLAEQDGTTTDSTIKLDSTPIRCEIEREALRLISMGTQIARAEMNCLTGAMTDACASQIGMCMGCGTGFNGRNGSMASMCSGCMNIPMGLCGMPMEMRCC